ncbi:catalase [Undibacterium sp. CY7W]|uniref:Catalase n=1 Tax=Undibacterium rugosum TaxID=2762291 RepID=A0A923I9M4_9BURK|nr:catalase [Undibacterium rugosum]MBR7779261.1 catalase [Undibacterium rugosum]
MLLLQPTTTAYDDRRLTAPATVSLSVSEAKSADSPASQTNKTSDSKNQPAKSSTASSQLALSEEAKALINQLKATNSEVRAHEFAHLAASGGLATGGPSFVYQKGPDGQRYAVGGEVNIDTSAGSTPQETIQRARTIQAAALAPAEPSGQDFAVAAKARNMEQQAMAALQLQRSAEMQEAYKTQAQSGVQVKNGVDIQV